MSAETVPATSKAEVAKQSPPVQGEVSKPTEVEELQAKLAEAQTRADKAERAFNAAQRKGKTADELQATLEKREEEFQAADKALKTELEKRDKLFKATLKPRLEALPEHTRKLVERAGKDGPEALVEALELAEKDAPTTKSAPQGGPLPSLKSSRAAEGPDGEFNLWDGFGEIANKSKKG